MEIIGIEQFFSVLALSNALAYQQSVHHLSLLGLGRISKSMTEVDASEAVAMMQMLNDPTTLPVPPVVVTTPGAT